MSKVHVDFSVNIDSSIAVYTQVENLVQFAVASGVYKAGDTLPSVRDLSTMLEVNSNTITKAYRDLELLGLVRTRRGVGVTISEKAPALCKKNTRACVRAHLWEAVGECLASGMSAKEVSKTVEKWLKNGATPYTPLNE